MFAQRLRELRVLKRLSQEKMAAILSVSPSAVSMYERGKRMADIETIKKAAQFFNVSTDYLLGANATEGKTQPQDMLHDWTDEEKALIYDHYQKTIQLYRKLSKSLPEE
jgi:transcriptional regulator with XRE-family HTH domain